MEHLGSLVPAVMPCTWKPDPVRLSSLSAGFDNLQSARLLGAFSFFRHRSLPSSRLAGNALPH